ncbi:serine/threonine-protein kinase irlF [Biomphalaria pfeifferi]|uniref:Serine/threonine-protein kinase irlF n=1 Tax=Biomphalaria pfeifferi TaxID=112525 RepID=A0AAD8F1Y9_BIOPF|nr:serine/threonine-protein kinase irlF [Biomphalaria pfeifferi]
MEIINCHQWKIVSCSIFLANYLSLVLTAPTTESPVTISFNHNPNRFLLDTDSLDFNKDGCISEKEEIDAFIAHVSSLLPKTTTNMLKARSTVFRSDVNRDGKICWCDFVAIYLQERNSHFKNIAPFKVLPDNAMFVQLDTDHDGQLKGVEKDNLEKEFSSCLEMNHAKLIVRSMDEKVNKDDSISLEEYERFMSGVSHTETGASPKPATGKP